MRTDGSPRPAWIGRPGLWLFGGLLALGAPCRAAEALPEPLKRHDVIVFAGDSLTEKGCEPDGFVTLVAAKGCQLLDLRRRFMEHLRANNPANAANGVLTTDGAHLNAAGNRFLADIMVHALSGTQQVAAASAPLPTAAPTATPGPPRP
jgi:hypothetical protein